MRDKVLIIIRGLPGSGKSTLAQAIQWMDSEGAWHYEADHYFYKDGKYNFVPEDVPKAHQECYRAVEGALQEELSPVIVSNTSARQWEYEKYIALAREYGYKVQVIDVHGEFNNVHGVPPEAVERMDTRWEPFNRNLLKRDAK